MYKSLLDEGANINATCRDTGATALMVSAAWDHGETVSFLMDRGASPLLRDNEGRTPLHVAAASGNASSLKILLNSKDVDKYINARVEVSEELINEEFFDSWVHEHTSLLPRVRINGIKIWQ